MTRLVLKMVESQSKRFFLVFFSLILLSDEIIVATRECCPPNTYIIKTIKKMCSDNKTAFNLNCEHGALLLDPSENENDKFSLGQNGTLSFLDGDVRSEDEFCIGKIYRPETQSSENLVAFVCFEDTRPQQDVTFIIHRVLMLISTLFLLLTLYIYAVLPNLKDLQGKCVIAFICCLTASYITLFVLQTFPNSSRVVCIIQAGLLYYFLCSTFFWNNIITFIIWKAIRQASYKIKETSRGIIYVLWGFGVPLLMLTLAFTLEHLPFGNHIRPQFGEQSCWFKGWCLEPSIGVVTSSNINGTLECFATPRFNIRETETWSYFYGPISIILLLNTLMFLQSICTLWKSYRTSPNSKLRSLRYKCFMYLRLFLLMGITWTFEVISYAAGSHKNSKYIWLFTDCLNGAQGVFIFLILVVFRQKVRLGLLKKKLFNINWPQSWAREEIQESSTASLADELELAQQKSQMMGESPK